MTFSGINVTRNSNANNSGAPQNAAFSHGTQAASGGALGICAISDRKPSRQYKISVYADMVTVKPTALEYIRNSRPLTHNSTRGKVRGFSRKARKRMIDTIAQVRHAGSILFLTLTYPDDFPAGDADRWRRDREAIRKRIMRRLPDWGFIWRTEVKERLSGDLNAGENAPHWHLLAFAPYQDDARAARHMSELLKRHWHDIAGAGDVHHIEHGADVRIVRGRRGAYYYVSKYVAKCDEEEHEIGRRWGTFGELDMSPSEFDAHLTRDQAVALKRLIRGWLKARGSSYQRTLARISAGHGFSVYGLGDSTEQGGILALVWFIRHAREVSSALGHT